MHWHEVYFAAAFSSTHTSMLQLLLLYLQNSNLVLQADRGKRRGEDGAGEVESLWGKTKGMKMGDRIATTRPPELEAKLQKAKVLLQFTSYNILITPAALILLHR
jgi:hypothetical protein